MLYGLDTESFKITRKKEIEQYKLRLSCEILSSHDIDCECYFLLGFYAV
jgi:hypothetical protein